MNKHIRWILGRPCFTFQKHVKALRFLGIDIPPKVEKEQAAAIHLMLNLYEKHKNKWQEHLEAFFDEVKAAKNQTDKDKILQQIASGKFNTKLNKHTEWILGLVNFQCLQYAHAIRMLGHNISEENTEDQQADVIHFMLSFYKEHGESWREKLGQQFKQLM